MALPATANVDHCDHFAADSSSFGMLSLTGLLVERISNVRSATQVYSMIIWEVHVNKIKKHTIAALVAKASIPMEEVPGKLLISEDEWQKIASMVKLTARECLVCRFIFEGNTRKEVAARMEISTRTVRHYLESVHAKLCVNGRVGVVLRLVQLRDFLAAQAARKTSQPEVGPSIPPQR